MKKENKRIEKFQLRWSIRIKVRKGLEKKETREYIYKREREIMIITPPKG